MMFLTNGYGKFLVSSGFCALIEAATLVLETASTGTRLIPPNARHGIRVRSKQPSESASKQAHRTPSPVGAKIGPYPAEPVQH